MKTYEDILKEVRKEFEMLDSWNVGSDTTDDKFRERVAKKYAVEVGQKALEDAAENARTRTNDESTSIIVDKQSILSTPLIIE